MIFSSFSGGFLAGLLHLGLALRPGFLAPEAVGATVAKAPVAAIKPAQTLRILSLNFNSETVPADHDSHLRDARFNAFLDWVRANDPDVILLQEVWNYGGDPSVALTLARALNYDVAYRLDMGAPGYMYDSDAVLAKKSLHMSDERDVELPHSAFHIGDGKSWILITGAVSYGVGVKLKLDNGEPLYMYTTHLIGSSDYDRMDQAAALSDAIRAQVAQDGGSFGKAKIVFGGDLNAAPGSPLDVYMKGAGYADAWEQTHPGDPGYTDCSDPTKTCFNPMQLGGDLVPSQNDEDSFQRIDHIYTQGEGIKTLATTMVFTTPFDGVWMSDHYGLLGTIGVNGQMPASVPDPARDYDRPLLPTTMLNLTSDMFDCWSEGLDNGCEHDKAPFYVVGPRGLTITDVKGCGFLEVRIDGPGDVYSSPHAWLDDGERATFVFSKDGDYTYTVSDSTHNVVTGVVHVRIGGFIDGPPPVVPGVGATVTPPPF